MKTIKIAILLTTAVITICCRAGRVAEQVDIVDRQGVKHEISCNLSPYTLLYFNDIDCDECHMMQKALAESAIISNAIEKKQLRLLSIYSGEYKDEWQQTPIHENWVECIDEKLSILKSTTYRYESFPALFLIDKKGKFLIENGSIKEIETYINKIR